MSYHISKGTNVRLKKVEGSGKIKIHTTRKDLEFTEAEKSDLIQGWYKFQRSGWYLEVKRKYVLKDNVWDLF